MTEDVSEPSRNSAALPSSRSSPSQPNAVPSIAAPQPGLQYHPDGKPRCDGQSNKKRKAKARRIREENMQADGAVSDSVLPPMASPHAKPVEKQREQSIALPVQNAQPTKDNVQKQRPVSVGGSNMLPATPLKEQAYAGPTFQASPAASALPMPKFFSKSVPNVAKPAASLDARMQGQKTPEQQSPPEPDVVPPQPPPRSAQKSPLDLLFNAQKAENQRKASVQSPEMKAQLAPPATEPRNPFAQTGKNLHLRDSGGDSHAMPSPKTVPPNNDDREAYTQQLKDLLFNGSNGLATQNAVTPSQEQSSLPGSQTPEQHLYTPSPTQRSTSGPSTPTPSTEQNNHYSLHYGNRNLSPLFKAARGETPSRPSNLRQHSSASESSPAVDQSKQHNDSNSFSRNYLDQHIRASPPATMPNVLGMHAPYSQQPYQAPLTHSSTRHVQQGVPTTTGSGASPRTGGSDGARDIKSMEDDLRRMLKVNVLGN